MKTSRLFVVCSSLRIKFHFWIRLKFIELRLKLALVRNHLLHSIRVQRIECIYFFGMFLFCAKYRLLRFERYCLYLLFGDSLEDSEFVKDIRRSLQFTEKRRHHIKHGPLWRLADWLFDWNRVEQQNDIVIPEQVQGYWPIYPISPY